MKDIPSFHVRDGETEADTKMLCGMPKVKKNGAGL